jgi:hypothetical protein
MASSTRLRINTCSHSAWPVTLQQPVAVDGENG